MSDTERAVEVAEAQAPAVPTPAASGRWTEYDTLYRLAQRSAATEMIPRSLRGRADAVFAAMAWGSEVGLAPFTALRYVTVIDGKVGLSSEGMRALVFHAGHSITVAEASPEVCILRGRRRDESEETVVEWTIDDAKRAGLLKDGSAWTRYPADMLVARATSKLCRLKFPDVIGGLAVDLDEPDYAG